MSKQVELGVEGMTCASCAARVERVLKRQSGVEHAGVNFATGRASIAFDETSVGVDALQTAVERIGYRLVEAEPDRDGRWRARLALAAPASAIVVVLNMAFMHE